METLVLNRIWSGLLGSFHQERVLIILLFLQT